MDLTLVAIGALIGAALWHPVSERVRLSLAKHPSLTGHPRIAKRLAAWIPPVEFGGDAFFTADGAPPEVAGLRRRAFERLAADLASRAPQAVWVSDALEAGLSDLQFTSRYRVPFQFAAYARQQLKIGGIVRATRGVLLEDIDGNEAYDVGGSYGLNVFGYDFYKECIEAGVARVRDLGPVLGPYHPVVLDNVQALREISGLDEVSFHMSGTEAVMQAVRLARYHTGRSRLVRFAGAYHGWWDGVQPGIGNPRPVADAYTLRDMDDRTLAVLQTRKDIACVLVNPLQALHPNVSAPGDGTLVASDRGARFDRNAYRQWLQQLRTVCTDRGIALVFDEVFVGFRLALGGAQEFFGVRADLVTYGKTLGGGLPVGVLCGRADLMRRFNAERPSDVCFARGTFNAHPYVMATMHEFLRRVTRPAMRAQYRDVEPTWDARAARLNERFASAGLPVRVEHLTSIFTVCYALPSRYNWLYQFYLRAEGLALSWVGSGRLIFSHSYTDGDFDAVADRMVAAGCRMRDDGWWWDSPTLTNKAIRRQVLREFARATIGGRMRRHARGIRGSSTGPTDAPLSSSSGAR